MLLKASVQSRSLLECDGYRVVLAQDPWAETPQRWNDVALRAGADIFHTHEWHTAAAAAPAGRMDPAYLLAYRGDDLVGLCPAYLVEQCPRLDYTFALGRPDALRLRRPMLLAHSLAALTGGPIAVPGHPAVPGLLDAGLRRAAVALGAGAWGYANVPPSAFSGWLLGQGYATAEVATDYRVPIGWPTAERYWARLHSHRRRSLLAERRRSERAGITVTRLAAGPEEAVRLVHSLLGRRGTPVDVLPEPFIRAVLTALAPYERTLTARQEDGAPVALFAGWRFAGTWSVWLAGLDTDRLATFAPYHAMMSAAVESAITDGITTVDFGRANGGVKQRYGALPRPLLLAVKSADRATDALLHLWCQNLQRHHHAALNGLETTSRCC